jgi:hypothetical protein
MQLQQNMCLLYLLLPCCCSLTAIYATATAAVDKAQQL